MMTAWHTLGEPKHTILERYLTIPTSGPLTKTLGRIRLTPLGNVDSLLTLDPHPSEIAAYTHTEVSGTVSPNTRFIIPDTRTFPAGIFPRRNPRRNLARLITTLADSVLIRWKGINRLLNRLSRLSRKPNAVAPLTRQFWGNPYSQQL
jgi:hypothetical protein